MLKNMIIFFFFLLSGCSGKYSVPTKYTSFKSTIVEEKEVTISELIQNPEGWKETLNLIKNNFNFSEKMYVVTKLGGTFSDFYNNDRANRVGTNSDGVVSIEQLLESARNGNPGGVCRDVASAQAMMLQQMGIPRAYIISFKAHKGRHANIIAQNSEDANDIIQVNYGKAYQTGNETGAALLIQSSSMPDFGLEYKIYSAKGYPLVTIPSELGKILRETSSGSETTQIFSKLNSHNDKIEGVSINNKWNYIDQLFNIEIAGTFFKLEGTRSKLNIYQEGIYGRINAQATSPDLVDYNGFTLSAESSNHFAYMYTNNLIETYNYSSEEKYQFTEQVDMSIGLNVQKKTFNNNMEFSVNVNFVPTFNNEVSADKIILATNQVSAHILYSQFFLRYYSLSFESGLLFRDFKDDVGIGNYYYLNSSFSNEAKRAKIYINYSAPIQKNQARFLEGSTHKIDLGLNHSWKHIFNDIHYQADLDLDYYLIKFSTGLRF
jgi:hypothetical protein